MIIVNQDFDFLINTHGQIGLLIYFSFERYSLRRLYDIHPDCFKSYKDCCNFIEYKLREFELYASDILNHSGIFIYMLVSNDPYKYAVTTSIRHISSLSETAKLIKNRNVIVSITGEYVSS